MKQIVISGINLYIGGTLTIFKDMIRTLLENNLDIKYEIVCFVHNKELFSEYKERVNLIELKDSRSSYIKRIKYEFLYFNKYSKQNDVYIWISAQDITPNVKCEKLYTYCHNPMMFYKVDKKEIRYSKKLVIFSLLYKYVYGFNIKKNTYVIVQQEWIRKEFQKKYRINNILVARPCLVNTKIDFTETKASTTSFIFASQGTFFKNFEVICKAVKFLNEKCENEYEVWLTVDGSEGKYTSDLYKEYGDLKNIKWLGFQNKQDLFNLYDKSTCMIFPSKLETWGLPISEYKNTGKPIIVSDLPYAHETVGSYRSVAFFDPNNYKQLADIMFSIIRGYDICQEVVEKPIAPPYVSSWNEFWAFITNGD